MQWEQDATSEEQKYHSLINPLTLSSYVNIINYVIYLSNSIELDILEIHLKLFSMKHIVELALQVINC